MIRFPLDAILNRDMLEFLYSAQEKLRLEHNEMGRKFREGIITKNEWDDYLRVFSPRNYELSCRIAPIRDGVLKDILGIIDFSSLNKVQITAILEIKNQFMNSTRWNIDLTTLFQ